MKLRLIIILIILSLFGCYKVNITEVDVLNFGAWDSYIGVQNFNLNQQKSYLEPLINSGALTGVRLDCSWDDTLANWFDAQGVEVLGIFNNEHLRSPNVIEIFRSYVERFRFIKHWEIGNEVDHFIGMSAKEYMGIFDKLYQASREWDITLLSQAPFGNTDGAGFFKEMIDNGLDKYSDIIVALHFYAYDGPALNRFGGQVGRLSKAVPIWVTETGIIEQSKYVGYVNEIYPDIRNVLRAERIYWYVFSECSEHSMVSNLAPACSGEISVSPLYSQLVGDSVSNTTASKISSNGAKR